MDETPGSNLVRWSTNISCLFPEILENLFFLLPVPDLCRCRRVYRRWYSILTNPYFLRNYILRNFDLREGNPVPNEAFLEWRDSFVYYLEEDNEAEKYVFKPFPTYLKCGLYLPHNFNLHRNVNLNPSEFLKPLYQLQLLKQLCDIADVGCPGSKTCYRMSMVMFADDNLGTDLSDLPDFFLTRFGAHRYLRYTIELDRIQEQLSFHDDDTYLTFGVNGNTLGSEVCEERKRRILDLGQVLETMFKPSIAFYAGKCDHDNIIDPFLRVHLTRLSETLFGGIISGIK